MLEDLWGWGFVYFFMHDSMIYIAPISGLLKADLNLERIDTVPELIDNKVLDIKANTKKIFLWQPAESGLLTLRNEVLDHFMIQEVFLSARSDVGC